MIGLLGLLQPLKWILRILFVIINNVYCIPTYLIWKQVIHPLYYIKPELYWEIESNLFQWLLTCVGFWSYSAGYYIVESGDNIKNIMNEVTLVLVNHQSTADVPLSMHNFNAKINVLQRLCWVMGAVFQYTYFGIVSILHGDFFINAGRNSRDATLVNLEKYLRNTFLPRERKWLVLFPEGGFLYKRKEGSKRYAERNGLPILEHVTLPRLGAVQKIINTLAPPREEVIVGQTEGRLKYILDMTLAYPSGKPLGVFNVLLGNRPSCKIQLHYKAYRIEEVPHQNTEALEKWLYDIYIQKNAMLEHYYATGIFTADLDGNKAHRPPNGRVPVGADFVDVVLSEDESRKNENNYLRMSLLRVAFIHVMFITSSLFHLAALYFLYGSMYGLID